MLTVYWAGNYDDILDAFLSGGKNCWEFLYEELPKLYKK